MSFGVSPPLYIQRPRGRADTAGALQVHQSDCAAGYPAGAGRKAHQPRLGRIRAQHANFPLPLPQHRSIAASQHRRHLSRGWRQLPSFSSMSDMNFFHGGQAESKCRIERAGRCRNMEESADSHCRCSAPGGRGSSTTGRVIVGNDQTRLPGCLVTSRNLYSPPRKFLSRKGIPKNRHLRPKHCT